MDQIFKMLEDSGQSTHPRNLMDAVIAFEGEETDFSIALSLQEEEERKINEQIKKGIIALFEENGEHAEAETEEDEEFAMAPHESMETESLPGSEDGFTSWSYPRHLLSGQRFPLSENEDVIAAQLEEGYKSGRMQLMEDKEERFQLSEIEKVTIAQLEEDEKRQRLQMMVDEELAMSILIDSSAETGKGDIFQPNPSSVSSGRGFLLPEYENVSISQLEDVERRCSSQFTEDEQLAIALQKSLMVESPIQLKSPCAGCNSFGRGQFLHRMGAVWHSQCFRCHECSLEIVNEEFLPDGDRPYHKTCYEECSRRRCEVCKNLIPTRMELRCHPFWKRKYCLLHEEDGTPQCFSCERLEPKGMEYLSLEDGRRLCRECLESVIMDTSECQHLYREIQDFFEELDMKIEQHIPLELVKAEALNEAKGLKNGNHDLPETRGLTMCEGNEVTVILVLYGLPRLLLGNILSHEMTHSWLCLKGCHGLSPKVEEGICQVMAHRWLHHEIKKNTAHNSVASSSSSSSRSTSSRKGIWSDVQHKLANCFEFQIETDPCPIYGEGFRLGHQAVLKYGLKGTLAHIHTKRSFPG